MAALDDPLVGDRRPKLLAEVQAAIIGQRQLSLYVSDAAVADMHAAIVQRNLQQPWNTVLQTQKDILVRGTLQSSR